VRSGLTAAPHPPKSAKISETTPSPFRATRWQILIEHIPVKPSFSRLSAHLGRDVQLRTFRTTTDSTAAGADGGVGPNYSEAETVESAKASSGLLVLPLFSSFAHLDSKKRQPLWKHWCLPKRQLAKENMKPAPALTPSRCSRHERGVYMLVLTNGASTDQYWKRLRQLTNPKSGQANLCM